MRRVQIDAVKRFEGLAMEALLLKVLLPDEDLLKLELLEGVVQVL